MDMDLIVVGLVVIVSTYVVYVRSFSLSVVLMCKQTDLRRMEILLSRKREV